ncbi:MAG: Ku protein [Luteitalea sp.]|nr:Ku protein [Luteitalea sp.]
MAARPTWKGFLKVSLVNIPVRVFPATNSAASVSFNQLHEECQTRVQYKKWCPTHDRELSKDEIVRGYEFEKGRYVVVDDADLEKVRPPSTRVINLVQFADIEEIDPVYIDRPYYLAPDGPVAAEAFGVMREGMKRKVGIGKLALYGREYLVAVAPRAQGLVMYTLRRAEEIRQMGNIDEFEGVPAKPNAAEVKLAQQVISSFEATLDLGQFRDEYEEELRRIIDAKISGEEVVAAPEETPAKVVNLMDALRKSLNQVSDTQKRTAKAELAKPRATRTAPRKRARG